MTRSAEEESSGSTTLDHADGLLRAVAAAPPKRPMFRPLPFVLGTIRLESEIGKGGMNAVYRAIDLKLGRPIAAKVSRSPRDEEARARLYSEARAAARLQHERIVTVYAVEEHEGHSCLLMELVDGPSLARVLRADPGLFTPEAREAICTDVSEALAIVHEAGIVHRDVKPSNVLIDTRTGRAKLGDFGVARSQKELSDVIDFGRTGFSETGLVIGTPAYMAPEQIRGEPATHASDVFSLGLLLTETLTGTRPTRATPESEVDTSYVHGETRARLEAAGHFARAMIPVLERATRRVPSERYRDAHEMWHAVTAASKNARRARNLRAMGAIAVAVLVMIASFVSAVHSLSS